MNLVDSSGWLEYFAEGNNADFFAPAIEDTKNLLVPVICIYEVFKRILVQSGINEAQKHIGDMKLGKVIELDESIALSAAKISYDLKLPMADSFILAATRANEAILWTQDEHFKTFDDVKYIPKKYQR
ncbi:MAG: type II toxin-antitoxin system VapC family toxin [Anaerolineales bacterium]|nr:type II toxin-antitoxin system VapC family toxin [Anaerolineales bacterium]MCZ2121820.1 type II toxin-antitoxin system VapC family toxin [Anaerolineales bacterium]